MLKKVKLDKEMIHSTKARAKEISNKIDKLLGVEEQRSQVFFNATTTASRFTNSPA